MINTNIGVSKHHHVFYWSYNTNIYTLPPTAQQNKGDTISIRVLFFLSLTIALIDDYCVRVLIRIVCTRYLKSL